MYRSEILVALQERSKSRPFARMKFFSFDLESAERFRQIFVHFLFLQELYLYGVGILPGQFCLKCAEGSTSECVI